MTARFRAAILAGLIATALALAAPTAAEAFVYWAHKGTDPDASGAVGRAALDGTSVERTFIERTGEPTGTFCGVAASPNGIFWAHRGSAGSDGSLGRADHAGNVIGHGITNAGPDPCGVAERGNYLFWGRPGALGRALFTGALPLNSYTTAPDRACGVAVNSGSIFWADEGYGSVGRATPPGPSNLLPFFVSGADDPCGVAVDAAHLY